MTDFHGLTVMTAVGSPALVFGYDGAEQRIERSFDGGLIWTAEASLAAREILAVGDELYATTAGGLAMSTDDGASFTIVVFLLLVAVWCLVARAIGTNRRVIELLERIEHWLVPVVFIGLGLYILIESGVVPRRIDPIW